MKTLKERFEAKFEKSDSGCWNWTASKVKAGYGVFNYNGLTKMAHRVSYQLYIGEIPDGLCILHKCDNTNCVNPAHLFLGTLKDNTCDCINKGRFNRPSGEKHCRAIFTEEQVREIRAKREAGVRICVLKKEYGAKEQAISKIVYYHTWTKV